MKLGFFSVPALDPGAAQDALNRFLAQHQVVAVDHQLITEHGQAFWALCVTTTEGGASARAAASPAAAAEGRKRVDYKEVLTDVEFGVFVQLRDLRQRVADQAGVPVYTVFTNEQLAEMIRQKVTSKAGLGAIAGVGEGRLDKHGDAFLAVLKAAFGAAAGQG